MVLVVRSVSNGFNHYVPAAPLAKLMNLWKENLILWCWSSICRRIGSKSWWEELGRARVSIQNSDDAKWGPPFVHFPGPAAAWVPWSPGSRLPPPFLFFFFSPLRPSSYAILIRRQSYTTCRVTNRRHSFRSITRRGYALSPPPKFLHMCSLSSIYSFFVCSAHNRAVSWRMSELSRLLAWGFLSSSSLLLLLPCVLCWRFCHRILARSRRRRHAALAQPL